MLILAARTTSASKYVQAISADPENQTFNAIVTRDHAVGERIRPTIWPTPVLNEDDDLAFDISTSWQSHRRIRDRI